MKVISVLRDGKGRGYHGHRGRPGLRGGSLPRTHAPIPGRGWGGASTIVEGATYVASVQSAEICRAARAIGEEYFGDKLLWGAAEKNIVVQAIDDRGKKSADDVGIDWSVPEEREFVQLVDDFEYVFVYNSITGAARGWDMYLNKEGQTSVDDFKSFYKTAKQGEFLVSYWFGGEEIDIILP